MATKNQKIQANQNTKKRNKQERISKMIQQDKMRATAIFLSLFLRLKIVLSFSDSPYYYNHWCDDEGSASLQYLDDKYCAKVFPGSFDRSWTCPIATNDTVYMDPEIWVSDKVPLDEAPIDTTTLMNLGIRQDVQACLFMIKRVQSSTNESTSLRTRRLCSGGGDSVSFETWSSSKFIAMGNAGGKLREECMSGMMGLEANITYDTSASSSSLTPTIESSNGNIIETPLGDLATVVASYDTTAGLTSNSVSSYFNDLGWRDRAYSLATVWLKTSNDSSDASLGGNYGESTPAGLGFQLQDDDIDAREELDVGTLNGGLNVDQSGTCDAPPDADDDGPYENSLTALAFAEAHRRLALHREVSGDDLQFPNSTWEDISTILYGAETSILFPSVLWGGLSTDPAIYIQSSLEKAMSNADDDGESALLKMDNANHGTWRIFSKLGAGYSSSRSVGEIVTAGYGCMPFTSASDNSGSIDGYEFTIAARSSVALDYDLSGAEEVLMDAVSSIITAMVEGQL